MINQIHDYTYVLALKFGCDVSGITSMNREWLYMNLLFCRIIQLYRK